MLLSLHKQKKTLREQWLMDGLSTQSEEEQESVKAQTEDFQQKTKLLQSNIDRYSPQIKSEKSLYSITNGLQGSRLPDCEKQLDYSCLTTVMSFQC